MGRAAGQHRAVAIANRSIRTRNQKWRTLGGLLYDYAIFLRRGVVPGAFMECLAHSLMIRSPRPRMMPTNQPWRRPMMPKPKTRNRRLSRKRRNPCQNLLLRWPQRRPWPPCRRFVHGCVRGTARRSATGRADAARRAAYALRRRRPGNYNRANPSAPSRTKSQRDADRQVPEGDRYAPPGGFGDGPDDPLPPEGRRPPPPPGGAAPPPPPPPPPPRGEGGPYDRLPRGERQSLRSAPDAAALRHWP